MSRTRDKIKRACVRLARVKCIIATRVCAENLNLEIRGGEVSHGSGLNLQFQFAERSERLVVCTENLIRERCPRPAFEPARAIRSLEPEIISA
jgi:hypothetical protein